MRMCGMEHPSTRPDARLVIAAIAKADILKFGGLQHAWCKQISGFAISGRRARSASNHSGRPRDSRGHERKRVYDKNHKDYHNWDDRENRAWGQFLTENRRESHEYAKSNKKEQSEYWNWRHSHPDKD
jgi:hypothetical protein